MLIGNWFHPDHLSNHWLLAWVAEQVMAGEGVLHNPRYYWPVGDAPVLAGNGAEGFVYLLFHMIWGWPVATVPYVLAILTLNGLGGWAMGRSAGVGPWSALLVAGTTGVMPFTIQELSCGRFTQVSVCWLLFFLAAWLSFLDRPGRGRALVAAALLAATSFFYWYYGLFGVLAGGVLLLSRGRGMPPVRALLVFAAAYLAFIGPWALVFFSAWAQIPGTDELAFPHPQAIADVAQASLPLTVDGERHIGQTMPALAWLLGVAGGLWALVVLGRPSWGRGTLSRGLAAGLLASWLLFWLLSLGPAFPGAPYLVLYDLAAPLRRFWWPIRHIVVANAAWAVLGALALHRMLRRLPRAGPVLGLLLALLTIPSLRAQGAPDRVQVTGIQLPPEGYAELAAFPDGVAIEVPLSPRVAGTQQQLIYQRWHHKTLLTGHAPWVDRVRPPAWDALVAGNSFLSALVDLEEGRVNGELRFEAADLQSLLDRDVAYLIVNREHFVFAHKPVVQAYAQAGRALFGRPIIQVQGLRIFDLRAWSGKDSAAVPPAPWPETVRPGGPEMPLVGRRPASPTFTEWVPAAEDSPGEPPSD